MLRGVLLKRDIHRIFDSYYKNDFNLFSKTEFRYPLNFDRNRRFLEDFAELVIDNHRKEPFTIVHMSFVRDSSMKISVEFVVRQCEYMYYITLEKYHITYVHKEFISGIFKPIIPAAKIVFEKVLNNEFKHQSLNA